MDAHSDPVQGIVEILKVPELELNAHCSIQIVPRVSSVGSRVPQMTSWSLKSGVSVCSCDGFAVCVIDGP